MKKILVIAPHPDDETIGCAGTLLRHKARGDQISCILATKLKPNKEWKKDLVNKKENEIEKVKKIYKFKFFERLDFLPRELDSLPLSLIISKISVIFDKIKPEIIYIPYIYDVHTDHQIISKSALSSAKWFRSNYIKKIYMYETLSETNFNFSKDFSFQPNVFVDISKFIKKKLEISRYYKSEIKKHPIPRSVEAIKALAILRGSQSGFKAAESFKLIFNKK